MRTGTAARGSTLLDDAELALSNLHIREGENRTLVLNHEFITPIQGMITNPS